MYVRYYGIWNLAEINTSTKEGIMCRDVHHYHITGI